MFHAEIEATNHCNTRCLHCPHERISRPRGRMSFETFATIITNVREHLKGERYSLSFSGMGEPLLNPELPRFIRHVSGEARTSFACNGALLTEKNVRTLIEAGLDSIYVSFNGDEREVYEQMMGGLPFERALQNLRRAVSLASGTRLEIRANVSATKQTQSRLTSVRTLLRDAGVNTITFSQAHRRGGNLHGTDVCDTPASPPDLVHCAVIAHTLFVDWRGRVFICDHDLHGEHSLGDLTVEPLGTVLERRQTLIDQGMPYEMCRRCDDLLKGGFEPFGGGGGGILSDWVYALHETSETTPFAHATPAQRWILGMYRDAGRLDRAVDRLLAIEQALQRKLAEEQDNREVLRGVLLQEVDNRDRRIVELEHELTAIQQTMTWRIREWLRRLDGAISCLGTDRRPRATSRMWRFLLPAETKTTAVAIY